MATLFQVIRAANQTGCDLEIQENLVTLYAPDGFAFEGEYRMLGREAERGGTTKAEIYDEMLDAMDDIRQLQK